ncbi:hypothetical protein APA_3100 [Pseudanabaena sp. lw0831]|nr:hypothetical protein APA_3100 [Pseudanabaena sp. lw0831]
MEIVSFVYCSKLVMSDRLVISWLSTWRSLTNSIVQSILS